MLRGLIRSIVPRAKKSGAAQASLARAPLRLHVGGTAPHPDWKVLNVLPGPHVDYVGSCTDLSTFGDSSVAAVCKSLRPSSV